MPQFSFEIAHAGEPPFLAQKQELEDMAAAWCQVEALSLAVRKHAGATIRVRNAEGRIIIFAGVATALTTFERCSRAECPLKHPNGKDAAPAWRAMLPAVLPRTEPAPPDACP
jgi:hypothetical protein